MTPKSKKICVWKFKDKKVIADIKTTSVLDKKMVEHQLSIYSYLCELKEQKDEKENSD